MYIWTDWLVCWSVQVLALAQLVGLPLQDQANFLMRRALLCKANGQPFAAFTNCLHAAQVPLSRTLWFASFLVAPLSVLYESVLVTCLPGITAEFGKKVFVSAWELCWVLAGDTRTGVFSWRLGIGMRHSCLFYVLLSTLYTHTLV